MQEAQETRAIKNPAGRTIPGYLLRVMYYAALTMQRLRPPQQTVP